ncbi:hypothetical protein ILYODFUR_023545 [Ilyodon furcidens]|uniref:Uncharacterized protein n=1 Tax=Ilyodon furcidens TaxID=33524 RepID=A0ABV0V6J3_9TELE
MNHEPPQLTPSSMEEQQLHPDDGALPLKSKATEGTHFSCLGPGSHDHRLGVQHRWSRKSRALLFQLRSTLTTTDLSKRNPHPCIHFLLHSAIAQDRRTLYLLIIKPRLSPDLEGLFHAENLRIRGTYSHLGRLTDNWSSAG